MYTNLLCTLVAWTLQRSKGHQIYMSGFAQENLPFKYLGVPISAGRISAAQCEVLIEKMTRKIRLWSSKNLSYTTRVQLLNSVLLSLHMYWAQVFLLSKKIFQEICRICKCFLWSGQYYCQKPSSVARDSLCRPKSARGLGFRIVMLWNVAFIGKYVWAVSTKQDSVWLKWIHSRPVW